MQIFLRTIQIIVALKTFLIPEYTLDTKNFIVLLKNKKRKNAFAPQLQVLTCFTRNWAECFKPGVGNNFQPQATLGAFEMIRRPHIN